MRKNSPIPVTKEQCREYLAGFESGQEKLCVFSSAFYIGSIGIPYRGQNKGYRAEPQIKFQWQRGFYHYMFSDNK